MIKRLFHHVWVGDKQIPKSLQDCMASWDRFHPQWERRLWRDDDVYRLPLVGELCKQSDNPVFVSDLAKAEIVMRYGGVYADTDIELVRGVNFLRQDKIFFGKADARRERICAAFYGSVPMHPFMQLLVNRMVEEAPKHIGKTYHPDMIADGFWGRVRSEYGNEKLPWRFHIQYMKASWHPNKHTTAVLDARVPANMIAWHHITNLWKDTTI